MLAFSAFSGYVISPVRAAWTSDAPPAAERRELETRGSESQTPGSDGGHGGPDAPAKLQGTMHVFFLIFPGFRFLSEWILSVPRSMIFRVWQKNEKPYLPRISE